MWMWSRSRFIRRVSSERLTGTAHLPTERPTRRLADSFHASLYCVVEQAVLFKPGLIDSGSVEKNRLRIFDHVLQAR